MSVPLMLLCDDFAEFCGYLRFQISKLLQSGSFYPARCSNPFCLLIFTLPKLCVCDKQGIGKYDENVSFSLIFQAQAEFHETNRSYDFVPVSSFSIQFAIFYNVELSNPIVYCLLLL